MKYSAAREKHKIAIAGGYHTGRPHFSTKHVIVDDEKIYVIRHDASAVYILGTNHIDSRYVLIVQKLIKRMKPAVVGVELCRTRTGYKHRIAGDDNDQRPFQHPAAAFRTEFQFQRVPAEWWRSAVREKLGLLYAYGAIRYAECKMFRVELQRYQQMRIYKLRPPVRVGESNILIGAELLAPFQNMLWRCDGVDSKYLSNTRICYKILLLDRPLQQTYALMAEALTDEEKEMVKSYKKNFEPDFMGYREQNEETFMSKLLLNRDSKLYGIFVKQRDEYMAKTIFTAIVKDKMPTMFCIIGRSHVNGVLTALTRLFNKEKFDD